jgi:hypothetical protein
VNSIPRILYSALESLGLAYVAADFDCKSWAFAEADPDRPGIMGFHQGATATTTLAVTEEILAGSGPYRRYAAAANS